MHISVLVQCISGDEFSRRPGRGRGEDDVPGGEGLSCCVEDDLGSPIAVVVDSGAFVEDDVDSLFAEDPQGLRLELIG